MMHAAINHVSYTKGPSFSGKIQCYLMFIYTLNYAYASRVKPD